MEEILHANIFFFITSVAVVLFTIFLSIALYYIARAARSTHLLLEDVHNAFKSSEEFVESFVSRLEENRIFAFLFPSRRAKEARVRKNKEEKGPKKSE